MTGRRRARGAGIVGIGAVVALLAPAPGAGASPAAAPADTVGRWTQPFEEGGEGGAASPRCRPAGDDPGVVLCRPGAAEAAVLGDGRVFYFEGIENREDSRRPVATGPSADPSSRGGRSRILDLRSGTPTWTDPAPAEGRPAPEGTSPAGGGPAAGAGDLFCSGVTTLADGRVLMAGGEGGATRLFDPESASVEAAAPMKHDRWYPHLAIGPDGDPTVFGGVGPLIPGSRPGSVRRTETYRSGTGSWEENDAGPESENSLPLQPRIVVAPNGQFFYAAAGQRWVPSGQAADDALSAFFQFFDPGTRKWSVASPAPLGARSGAFVVPLTLKPPYGQMTLVTGGGVLGPTPDPGLPAIPSATLTSIDADGDVTDASAGDLNHARWYSSGVLLPDGKVLAVGGADTAGAGGPGSGRPVLTPELYDPETTRWTEVAPHQRVRADHHTALLLPDMRVLVGGTAPAAEQEPDPSFEIWSPPYLFRGPRPSVERVQKGVAYGETFAITTPDAALIESVLLLRTPSPDHGHDSDQRSLELEFTRRGEHLLAATAPPSGNVAPPGTYYLVVNQRSLQGPIPSVARLVDVGRSDRSDAPQPYPDDPPAPAGRATPTVPPAATISRRWLFAAR